MSYTFVYAKPNTLVLKNAQQQRVAQRHWKNAAQPLFLRDKASGLQWYGQRHANGTCQVSIGNANDDILWNETLPAEVDLIIHEVFEDRITAIYVSDAQTQVHTRDLNGNTLSISTQPHLRQSA